MQASPTDALGVCEPTAAPRMVSPLIDFAEGDLDSKDFLKSCGRLAPENWDCEKWRAAWRHGGSAQKNSTRPAWTSAAARWSFAARRASSRWLCSAAATRFTTRAEFECPGHSARAGRDRDPGGLLPAGADDTAVRGHVLGLRPEYSPRGPPGAADAGVYALYCSNYSCGPDSFNLHFAAYIMEGKPFAIIETDGHSGEPERKRALRRSCIVSRRNGRRATEPPERFRNAQLSGVA